MIMRKRVTMYIDVEADVPEEWTHDLPSNEDAFNAFAYEVKRELENEDQKVSISGFMEDVE